MKNGESSPLSAAEGGRCGRRDRKIGDGPVWTAPAAWDEEEQFQVTMTGGRFCVVPWEGPDAGGIPAPFLCVPGLGSLACDRFPPKAVGTTEGVVEFLSSGCRWETLELGHFDVRGGTWRGEG